MDIRPLTPDYAVSPQIAPEDAGAIAVAGFTTVICNRPDGEIPPDLHADTMRRAIEAAGLTFIINPIMPGGLGPEAMAEQADAMTGSTGPVLAYCASGNRSAIVWSLIKLPELGTDGVLAATSAAGYDHSPFRGQFTAMERG